jgi:hypothetical protein
MRRRWIGSYFKVYVEKLWRRSWILGVTEFVIPTKNITRNKSRRKRDKVAKHKLYRSRE